ncbi:hypothetical protein [Fibrella arboris]|uniref:hypothetical protein n=1 Tax=Fibrella arboris TaxID=3242486 RepID=UPI003520D584
MKTIKFWLLLAFLASPVIIFSSFRPRKEKPVQTSIQGDALQNRLRLDLAKPQHMPVTLRVLDAGGEVLHEQAVPVRATHVQARLNLHAVPNGTYRVEVEGPRWAQAHLVQLSATAHPVLKRRISVWTTD